MRTSKTPQKRSAAPDHQVKKGKHRFYTFSTQLHEILKDPDIQSIIINCDDSIEKWVKGVADAYNGTKHLDRDPGSLSHVIHYSHEAYQLLRYWIAIQLGCPTKKIFQDIKNDKNRKIIFWDSTQQLNQDYVSIFR